MGFLYPIRFDEADVGPLDFRSLVENLQSEFGKPVHQMHFTKGYGIYRANPIKLRHDELRWFAGAIKWNSRSHWTPGNRHMVFRTEQDRTWARILIGK
jgi:hypothetical protein